MAKIVVMNNGAAFSCLSVKGEKDGKKIYGDVVHVNAHSAIQVDKATADYILELYPERCSIAAVFDEEKPAKASKKSAKKEDATTKENLDVESDKGKAE